jgi:Uncharacterized conserved protein
VAKAAFDGEGARLWGGRWNSPGRPAVYCAGHVSLAILEVVVHADLALAPHYVVIPVDFDDGARRDLDPGRLPASWRRHPAPAAVVALGTSGSVSAGAPSFESRASSFRRSRTSS